MAIKRVTPEEAAGLMKTGWKYIDVRSIPEFEAGHPSGAYNIPISHQSDRGLVPNPEFAAVVSKNFAKDEPIIVGCRSGGRSLRAAEILQAQGFTQIVDMRGGFGGEVGPGGKVACAGWQAVGLPVATEAASGHAYGELKEAP